MGQTISRQADPLYTKAPKAPKCIDHHFIPVVSEPEPAKPQATPTMSKVGGRGANHKPEEDAILARGWIHASEDPITGTDQTMEAYADKINNFYNKNRPATSPCRSFESVKNRVKLLNKECVKFSCCYARIQRLKPSGANVDDLIRMATAVYNGKEINTPKDDCGKSFRYLAAWEVLKDHENFLSSVEKFSEGKKSPNEIKSVDQQVVQDSQRSHAGSDGSSVLTADGEEKAMSRPVGRRKAKEIEEKRRVDAKKIKVAEEAVKAHQARNEALVRHNEILAFTNLPGGCGTPEPVEYFRLIRLEALARMRKTVAAGSLLDLTTTQDRGISMETVHQQSSLETETHSAPDDCNGNGSPK